MKSHIESLRYFAEENPYVTIAILLSAWSVWTAAGLYGLYLSSWNTRTHRERLQYIKNWNLNTWKKIGIFQTTVTFLAYAALLGPIIYIRAKVDYYQWRIRQSTMGN